MHQLCFLYMLHYLAIYMLSEREKAATHKQGTVFTLARLNTFYYHELYHIQCQCVDELSRLV